MTTGIEWTDETWNPTTGCDRVSPGCDNCYALTMAKRLKAMGSADYQTDGNPATSGPGFGIATHAHRLDQPLRWKKPRKVFVNSMSDLFHVGVPVEHLAQVFAVMSKAPQHTFQILTKRHARMRSIVSANWFKVLVDDYRGAAAGDFTWPLPNVWLGVSVEDQKWANIRIPELLMTPAAVRFLSMEPLLGPVDLTAIEWTKGGGTHLDVVNGKHGMPGVWQAKAKQVDWVIVGGESGHGARPMHPDWARGLRDQCEQASVPLLFKQWGEWTPTYPAHLAAFSGAHHEEWGLWRVGKHAAGRELDGRTWDQYPAVAS